jgi:peroxiredoxin
MPLSLHQLAPSRRVTDWTGSVFELSTLWQSAPLVLVFVRHFGCPFCRDYVAQLRDASGEFEAAGGTVAIVTMGTVEQTRLFREQQRLAYSCLADPNQDLYRAFDVPRGNWLQVAGPAVWGPGLKAVIRSGLGKAQGDLQQLNAEFVIDTDGRIQWAHLPRTSSEQSEMGPLLECIRSIVHHSRNEIA